MIVLLIWVGIVFIVVRQYLRQVYSKFEKDGVKHLKPFPLVGNLDKLLLRQENLPTSITNLYKAFPEEKFVGRYEFFNQLVIIRDLELVKKITVKDYEYFLDHRNLFSQSDSYVSRNLFSLKGQEWKDMRSTLTPAFTFAKLRLMVPFMVEVGDQMITSMKKKIKSSDAGYIDIDSKDLTTRYANDVIASCAFGLKVDSHTDMDNKFFNMGRETTNFGFRQMLTFIILGNLPKLGRLLKLDIVPTATKEFFRNLVLDTMKDRELSNIIRPDMIHLLMEAKKEWCDDDLVAQAVVFFIAGFDTIASAMSFLLYELALNPEIQEKLGQEVKKHFIENDEKFDFKSIQDMPYLNMVVLEVLRLWPPGILLDRLCMKDYNLGKPNEKATKDFIIRKGSGVMIPMFAFHRDPQYFPNPEKFDPERFSDENKQKIHPYAYMPFGLGPRNCIGSKFALCEIKILTYQILQHLELTPCEKTCIPAELSKSSFSLKLERGHWLRFKARS